MKSSVIKLKVVAVFCLVCPLFAIASPTENEFDRCTNIAVAMLEHCLTENFSKTNPECWEHSQASHQRCVSEVIETHDPEERKKRIAAEKEAKQKAEESRLDDDQEIQ